MSEKQEFNLPGEDLQDTVTVMLDDGQELECLVLAIYEAGGREYIALLPEDEADAEEGTVFLYRYYEDEDGEPHLDNIESDAEYRTASNMFNQILSDADIDDIVDEEELGRLS